MTELLPFLKQMITLPGLSGYEDPISDLISATWQPLTDELSRSRIGSLHGLRRGTGSEPRPSILLATHMDAIGLMVTAIVDGFLRLSEIGGIDARVLPGQLVTVHGRKELPGVIVQPPSFLLPPEASDGPVPLEHLLVDVGLTPAEVNRQIRIGDLISFATQPIEFDKETLAGHSLDNRASVAALTHCLDLLQNRQHIWDVWAVATVQEEETLGGALTSAFGLAPQLAIAIDVTFAKGPGAPEDKTYPLGEGITLGWGPNIHPGLYKKLKDLADQLEIPNKLEPMPRYSGTDAMALQVAREGIPTMVVSIPLRYMHTPVEIISMKDVERTGRLLAEFIAGLNADFMDQLTLDD
ncbi:MAG TPA: aminopeptidase [Chloroflexi bacterium]|nr:aminopeptidase [Chloroflexota bacterium]